MLVDAALLLVFLPHDTHNRHNHIVLHTAPTLFLRYSHGLAFLSGAFPPHGTSSPQEQWHSCRLISVKLSSAAGGKIAFLGSYCTVAGSAGVSLLMP